VVVEVVVPAPPRRSHASRLLPARPVPAMVDPRDANDANDTLHTLHGRRIDTPDDNLEEWYQNERKKIKPLDSSYFARTELKCYYCDDFEIDNSNEGKHNYEIHVKNKHGDDADHPCYPSKADLERLQLKSQWKRWEIQENADLQMSDNNKSKTREVKERAKLNNIPLTRHHTLESFGFHVCDKIGSSAHAKLASDTPDSQISTCYPLVKWAGGKRQLLSQLYPLAPVKFDRYIEPFLGGGAMFLHLISQKSKQFSAYISDIN